MTDSKRLEALDRRDHIIGTARMMSYGGGLYGWALQDVATRVGISRAAIAHYFGSTLGLRSKVVLQAIRTGDVPIVLQAIAANDPLAKNIPDTLRDKCRGAL